MEYQGFNDRLLQTAAHRLGILSVVAIIILVTLVVEIIFLNRKVDDGISIWSIFTKTPIFKQRLSLKQQIARDFIALAMLVLFVCFSGFPYYRDIANEQYVRVEAQYSRTENSSERNLFSNGHIYIQTDQESVRLELPANWNESEFPLGSFLATIWYSQESQIVLSVQPTD